MNTKDEHDRDLLLAYLDGDEAAFNELYASYNDSIRGSITNYVPANFKREIGDICQYFWLRFHLYSHTYNPQKPVRNWLFATALKTCARYYRDHMPKSSYPLPDYGRRKKSVRTLTEPCHRELTPEARIALNEDRHEVRKALGRIRPAFRDILQAIYFDGEPPLEYAKRVGIARGTVYTRIQRAITSLEAAIIS